ncbi:MAG: hypothetical protein M3Q73_01485 [bacterium]|nr:hypothetical protein [bacterium]
MDKKISDIITDLKQIDPGLASEASKMRPAISKFIEAKPDTQFNPAFAARLRSELMTKAGAHLVAPLSTQAAVSQPRVSSYWSIFLNNSYQASLAGALVAILVIAPATFLATRKVYEGSDAETYVKNITSGLSLKQQISTKGMNAFGKLSYVQANNQTGGMGGGIATSRDASLAPQATTAAPDTMTMGKGSSVGKMMVPGGEFTQIKYAYIGEALNLTETEGQVFKRVKNAEAGKQLAEFIKKSNFGLVNLPSFSSLGLQNLQLLEDKEFGYSINVSFDEGTITIGPDYRKWKFSEIRNPLPASSLPADAELIKLADAFVKEHGIDTSIYGQPVVENKTYTGNDAAGKNAEFAMDNVNVTYPLMLGGTEVYDESGNKYGLQVGIDIRLNKVSGVYNLTGQVYESSKYSLETEASKVIDAAVNGPQNQIMPLVAEDGVNQKITTETLTLQAPKRVLMRHIVYANEMTTELYVPALLFPIQQKKGVPYYQKNVVVPLIKDALAQTSGAEPMPVDIGNPIGSSSSTPAVAPELKPEVVSTTSTSSPTI